MPLDDNVLDLKKQYIRALEQELVSRDGLPRGCDVNSIYFGGGTPTLFAPHELESILNVVAKNFNVTHGAEISIEMNPQDVYALPELQSIGFNRFTMGVQTLSEKLHKTIGRSGELCTIRQLETFFSVPDVTHCIDVIGGIPGQTLEDLAAELKQIVSFKPEHISAYLLTLEAEAPLVIDFDDSLAMLQRDIFLETKRILEAGTYTHYEISNYALAGFESKHNMKYWTYEPYIGLGAGAHSFYNNRRFINSMTVGEYIQKPAGIIEEDVRSLNSAMAEYIMMSLRLLRGFSANDFAQEFGAPLPHETERRIKEEAEKGMLEITEENSIVKISREGLIFTDSIIYNVVRDLL